eukprot:COSAG05_NODE_296_length_11959_cov_17.897639_9_plen_163_part_00
MRFASARSSDLGLPAAASPPLEERGVGRGIYLFYSNNTRTRTVLITGRPLTSPMQGRGVPCPSARLPSTDCHTRGVWVRGCAAASAVAVRRSAVHAAAAVICGARTPTTIHSTRVVRYTGPRARGSSSQQARGSQSANLRLHIRFTPTTIRSWHPPSLRPWA